MARLMESVPELVRQAGRIRAHEAADPLASIVPLAWRARAATCVVLASGGYPGKYNTGKAIRGLDQASDTALCWSDDPAAVRSALEQAPQVFVLSERDDHKVRGFGPETVSRLYGETGPAHLLLEADEISAAAAVFN